MVTALLRRGCPWAWPRLPPRRRHLAPKIQGGGGGRGPSWPTSDQRPKQGREAQHREWASCCRRTKGTFHAKMGSIKDRNDMDLREAEDIKNMWQEYTNQGRPIPEDKLGSHAAQALPKGWGSCGRRTGREHLWWVLRLRWKEERIPPPPVPHTRTLSQAWLWPWSVRGNSC